MNTVSNLISPSQFRFSGMTKFLTRLPPLIPMGELGLEYSKSLIESMPMLMLSNPDETRASNFLGLMKGIPLVAIPHLVMPGNSFFQFFIQPSNLIIWG